MKCFKEKTTNLFHLWFLTGLMVLFGQHTILNAQGFCQTDDVHSQNSGFEPIIQNLDSDTTLYLKIYVHVIRNGMGLGGQSPENVDDALAFLDLDFNPHNIFFSWDCEIDYIDSDAWYNGPNENVPNSIFNVNKHYDGIDIYLFPDETNKPGGRANGVGSSSEFWVTGTWAGGIPVARSHIISHEMGHVLNLWHTHHGCESGNWEPTDGSSCNSTGDYVCDTPSDPHLSFNVDPKSCLWNGVNLGWCVAPEPLSSYNPDTELIMAYTAPECMAYFSLGQGARMRSSILTLPYLISVQTGVSSGCCDADLQLTGVVNSDETFEASNTITSVQQITSTANVVYSAGNSITLQPGFLAVKGSNFHALIGGCDGAGNTGNIARNQNNAARESAFVAGESSATPGLFAFPNPFNFSTKLTFQLKREAEVNLMIYDLSGRKIKQLENSRLARGLHEYKWNAGDLPPGVYLAQLIVEERMETIRVVLTR